MLSAGSVYEIYFFDDPVAGAQVVRIAELFGLDLLTLYFDGVESDFH